MRINTKQLSHSKQHREFVAEASDIKFNACAQAIQVVSEKTGAVVEFQYSTCECERSGDEDYEITSWVYTIAPKSVREVPALAGYKLTILND